MRAPQPLGRCMIGRYCLPRHATLRMNLRRLLWIWTNVLYTRPAAGWRRHAEAIP
jgi:hypothetical protein